MKKLFLLFALPLFLFGCAKDDGFNPSKFSYEASGLYGTWYRVDDDYGTEQGKSYSYSGTLTFTDYGGFSCTGFSFPEADYRFDGEYIHAGECTIHVHSLDGRVMKADLWYGDDTGGLIAATFTKVLYIRPSAP